MLDNTKQCPFARRPLQVKSVFSHISTSVTDFDRAFAFYSEVQGKLGLELRFHEPEKTWASWHSPGGVRPFFVICKPYDGPQRNGTARAGKPVMNTTRVR